MTTKYSTSQLPAVSEREATDSRVKDGSLYENGRLVSAEEGMKYEKVTVDGKTYVVNESGKVKTSGTVTDADGVKYKITKDQNGGYNVEVSW